MLVNILLLTVLFSSSQLQAFIINSPLKQVKLDCTYSQFQMNPENRDSAIVSFDDDFIDCKLPVNTNQYDEVDIVGVNYLNNSSFESDLKTLTIIGDFIKFPHGIHKFFPQIKNLGIEKSNLNYIERNFFENLNTLKSLSLNNNQIEEIAFDAFYDLTDLKSLSFNNNQIKHLNVDIFIKNPQLNFIAGSFNKIEVLSREIFRNNPNLEYVLFNNNNFKEINVNFQLFSKIKVIRFDYEGEYYEDRCDVELWGPFYYKSDRENKLKEFQDEIEKKCRENNNDDYIYIDDIQ